MKKGVIEQKILFTLFELILVLMVGAALFAYVKTVGSNDAFVYDYLARHVGLTLTVLAASSGSSSVTIEPLEFKETVFLEVDPKAVSVYEHEEAKRQFYYLAPSSFKTYYPRLLYNDTKTIGKNGKFVFQKQPTRECESAGFVIDAAHDFKKEPLLTTTNQANIQLSILDTSEQQNSPNDGKEIILIKAHPSSKKILCKAEESGSLGVGYFDTQSTTSINVTLYNVPTPATIQILQEVFS